MKAVGRMKIGVALVLATFLAVLGIGLRPGAPPGSPKIRVVVGSDHPDASRPAETGTKSTFTVDGVPLIVDEETVIYA